MTSFEDTDVSEKVWTVSPPILDPFDDNAVFKVYNIVVYDPGDWALIVPTTIIDPDFNYVIVISVFERLSKAAIDSVIC